MKLFKGLGVTLLALLIILLATAVYFNASLGQDEIVIFEIHELEKLHSITKRLKEDNLIRSQYFAHLYGKVLLTLGKVIKKGKHRLKGHSTTIDIMNTFTGKALDPEHITLTIPEGSNIYEIAKIFTEKQIIKTPEEFLDSAFDKTVIEKYQIDGDSLEGYLYPSTYFIRKTDNVQVIIDKMVQTFFKEFRKTNYDSIKETLKLNKRQIITLASLVEKETGVSEERKKVASVFYNRMNKKMTLSFDSSVIYALLREAYDPRYQESNQRLKEVYALLREGKYHKALNKAVKIDKLSSVTKSPFNTYRYKGLPPTPIASPRLESIQAVINPAKTEYLYFVAKDDKSHEFAKTAAGHQKNIEVYRRFRKKQREKKN
ncbi:MAG: aminodeoxychorismate lyase [bacterium]|nr:MAG: aminodeoxychorismate lyase [bacterium]